MFLNDNIPNINSKRNHIIIAVILGVLVAFVIIFLRPFGAGQPGYISFPFHTLYFSGYGLLVTLTYSLTVFLFNFYYQKTKQWKWAEEIVFLFSFVILVVVFAHFYTELVINKNPSRLNLHIFMAWFKTMFPSFGTMLLGFSFFLRRYFAVNRQVDKTIEQTNEEKINIKSALKNEGLKIAFSEIVYIKSEDNYVFVYFLDDGNLKNKMLRSTLSNIQKQIPELFKVHRSYLINLAFADNLSGNSQNAKLGLTKIEDRIPVSKTYYHALKERIN